METRFKSLVEVVPKGEAAQCAIPQEKCDTACTGEASMSLIAQRLKEAFKDYLADFFR